MSSSVHSARNSIVSLVSSNDAHSHVDSRSVQTKLVDEGAMLPSSSSKDEDILSDSSDEIENIAMQTLEHLHEPQPQVPAAIRAPSHVLQVHRKSVASSQSAESTHRSKRESKVESVASKKGAKANGELAKSEDKDDELEKEGPPTAYECISTRDASSRLSFLIFVFFAFLLRSMWR
uniref:Uncharacterized protein n=1 Tax=Steinernema glaseri TaxID=37863 RepID=A0A1I8AN90_9BILA